MSRPLIRPVTATIRFRLSRVISGWPRNWLDGRHSGQREEVAVRARSLQRAQVLGSVARLVRGIQTRTPIICGPARIWVVTMPVR